MTIRYRVTVLPGGRIRIQDPRLPDGAEADVLITVVKSNEDLRTTPMNEPTSDGVMLRAFREHLTVEEEGILRIYNSALAVGAKVEVIILLEPSPNEDASGPSPARD